MEFRDYRGFKWVEALLTYEVTSRPFYHNNDLVCSVDVWNSTGSMVSRRDEVLYSKIEAKYEAYLKAKEKAV